MSKPAPIGTEPSSTSKQTDSLATIFSEHVGAEVQINKTKNETPLERGGTLNRTILALTAEALESPVIKAFRQAANLAGFNFRVVLSRKETITVDGSRSHSADTLNLYLSQKGNRYFVYHYGLR